MELGLLSGTSVRVVRVAPLRDPMELEVRRASLSIRRADAERVVLQPSTAEKGA
jgi:ferrous iron transport protein A